MSNGKATVDLSGMLTLVADLTTHPIEHLGPASRLGRDLQLDSLSLVELLVAVEHRYGVQLGEAQLGGTLWDAVTVSDLVAAVGVAQVRSAPVSFRLTRPAAWSREE